MNVRQDFTDLDKKVNSFVDFLRRLNDITLGQFGQLNQFYLQVKDLEDDNWKQNGEDWKEVKAQAAYNIFYGILNIYRDSVDFDLLTFEVSTISWVIDDNSLEGIIYGYEQMLNEEFNTISSMSPNDKEGKVLDVLQRSFSTISRLRSAIGNTTRDGHSIYNGIWDFVYRSFDGENLNDQKRDLFLTFEQALHTPAQDCFRALLKAILESDKIDSAMQEETKSFDELLSKLNEEISVLTDKIQQLQVEIKDAKIAESIIAKNNLEIDEASAKIASIDEYINKLNSDEASAQAEIDALDTTSETYEADLAALQATIAKIQTEKASQMENSSMIQADIASMSAENAELSPLVDQLDEKQDELVYSEKYKMELTKEISKRESDYQATLDRFERKRQDLPLDSSPSQRGGRVWQALSDRIRVIDGIMVNASNYRGYPLKSETSIKVPGMPSFTNSVALDLDFGYALQDLGFGDELLSKFNFQNPIEIENSGSYWGIWDLMGALRDNKIITERAKEMVDNYSSINFTSPVAESLRMEVNLEKLDAKKIEVVANLLKETTSYDALTQEISDTNSQIQNSEASRNQLSGDIKATVESIEKYTASISINTESLSNAQVNKSDSEAIKVSYQVTKTDSEQVKADAESTKATAEATIADSSSTKAGAEATLAQAQSDKSGAEDILRQAKATRSVAQKDLDNAKSKLDKSQNKITGYQYQKAGAEATLAQAQSDKSTVEATLAQAQSDMAVQVQAKADYLANDGTDQTIIDGYDLAIADFKSAIATNKAAIASYEQVISESQATIANVENSIATQQAYIATYQATIDSKTAIIEQANIDIVNNQAIIDSANVTISEASKSIADAQATIFQEEFIKAGAESTIAEATKSISEAEAIIAQADANIAQYQSEIDALTSDIQADTVSKMTAEESLNSLLRQLRTIEDSLNELYSTMESLKEKSSLLAKVIDELNVFIADYDADRASMVSYIDEMTVGYDQVLAEYKLTLKQLYKVNVDINSTIEDTIQQITVVKSKSNIRNNKSSEEKEKDS